MLSESTMLRCIANCLETSQFYVGKGDRASAGWWNDRANMLADGLAAARQTNALATRPTYANTAPLRNDLPRFAAL